MKGRYEIGQDAEDGRIVSICRFKAAFCTKYRRKVLEGDIARRLEEIIKDVCSKGGVELIELQIEPGTVVLSFDAPPRCGEHRVIKTLKAASSSILREEFPEIKSRVPSLWTNSYCIYSLGTQRIADKGIERFIKSQPVSQRAEKNLKIKMQGL